MSRFLQAFAGGITSPADAEGRQFGAISGIVTEVDSGPLGRVRARLKGMEDGDSTDWLSPMLPGSIWAVPEKGEAVAVFSLDGDINRGLYCWHPQTRTRRVPSESMVLGDTFMRLYNGLCDKVASMQSTYNTLVTRFNTHTHDGVTVGAGTTAVPSISASTNTASAGKGKASDGSTPSALAADTVALSGTARCR